MGKGERSLELNAAYRLLQRMYAMCKMRADSVFGVSSRTLHPRHVSIYVEVFGAPRRGECVISLLVTRTASEKERQCFATQSVSGISPQP